MKVLGLSISALVLAFSAQSFASNSVSDDLHSVPTGVIKSVIQLNATGARALQIAGQVVRLDAKELVVRIVRSGEPSIPVGDYKLIVVSGNSESSVEAQLLNPSGAEIANFGFLADSHASPLELTFGENNGSKGLELTSLSNPAGTQGNAGQALKTIRILL